jgi:hypothetical protein
MSVRLLVIFMMRLSRMCVCEPTIDPGPLMAKRLPMAARQIGKLSPHKVLFDGYTMMPLVSGVLE